jgi:hypothetical protein
MDQQVKKHYFVLALEALVVIPLCILGLLNFWFIVAGIFSWLAFTVYRAWVFPGGPW